MGTLLPLKRKEIGNELSLYYTQSTSLEERSLSIYIYIFCHTVSKTKQVNRTNLVF